jgi:MFS family permease
MAFSSDFSALRNTLTNRNFAIFTAGNGISLIGNWAQRVAVGWLTWELTHSAAWLGAVSMAEFLPVIFLAPVTGVLADRFDRRRIAVIGQILAAMQAFALAALTLSGSITPLLLLLLQVFAGVVQPLIQTARLVLVPTLVPRENVGNAVAVTALMFNIARVIGPAFAGLLIATVGVGFAFAVNTTTYIFVISALMMLKLPPHQPVPSGGGALLPGIWADFAEGARYTFTQPTLRWVILLVTAAASLTWPVSDFLAGVVDQEFDRGVTALAIFTSANGIGAAIGSIYLAQRKHGPGSGTEAIMIYAVLLNGLFTAAFALTKNFWIAVGMFGLTGLFLLVGGAASQTVVQTTAEDHMRGRVLSIWFTLTRIGPAIGALALGVLSNWLGFTAPICAAGLLTAAAAIFVWRKERKNIAT